MGMVKVDNALPSPRHLTLKQQRFVDALPTANSQAAAARIAGYSDASEAAKVQASKLLTKTNVICAINANKLEKALSNQAHIAAAQALFIAKSGEISQAMVTRAVGEGRDSQRAGERILETVGVLQKESLVGSRDPSMDAWVSLVALMARQMQEQAPDTPLPSIEAEVQEVLGAKDAIQE